MTTLYVTGWENHFDPLRNLVRKSNHAQKSRFDPSYRVRILSDTLKLDQSVTTNLTMDQREILARD